MEIPYKEIWRFLGKRLLRLLPYVFAFMLVALLFVQIYNTNKEDQTPCKRIVAFNALMGGDGRAVLPLGLDSQSRFCTTQDGVNWVPFTLSSQPPATTSTAP